MAPENLIITKFHPQSHSLSELTAMLHEAYAPLLQMGLRFTATTQNEEKTLKRISRGHGFVASVENRIVGTITYQSGYTGIYCDWYKRQDVGHFSQFAVRPEFQGQGIGRRLLDVVTQLAGSEGKTKLALDTSERAHHLIEYYRRQGFVEVGRIQWPTVNYRSVVLSRVIDSSGGPRGAGKEREEANRDFQELLPAIRVVRPEVEAIENVRSFRPSYRFFPARMTLTLENGATVDEVLKTSAQRESLQWEKDVLEALGDIGLPVPQVRSAVLDLGQQDDARWGLLLQELEGSPPAWLGLDSLQAADTTCQVVLSGVERLHRLTDRVLQHPISSRLPRRSLAEELESIRGRAGPWWAESFFQEAFRVIEDRMDPIAVPLVFSNGDYNPLNFLSQDTEVVGWLDFELACFEDPHIGFAKFVLWADDSFGWGAGAKAGLVERYCFNNNVRPSDFYCRLVLRGLSLIQSRSVTEPPLYMIEVVKAYTEKLKF